MATILRVVEDPPEVVAAEWLHDTDDKLLACRAMGHAFPKLRAGRIPKGISALRQHDGSFQITSVCRDCGTERTLTTLPGGRLDLPASYTYRWPKGYQTPKGAHLSRRECLAELWDRSMQEITSRAEVMPSA